jgi:diamine N-acetyltransferase
MRDTVEIRALREDEIPALCALAGEIWRAHYPGIISVAQIEYMLAERYDPAVIRAELARGEIGWDVLMQEERMAGYTAYFLSGKPNEMKIDKLYLHPRVQRRGFGGRLIDHVAAAAARRGCTHLALAVNRHNRSAIAAYRKHGFRIVDTSLKKIGGGFWMDDYLMTRPVNG